MECRTGYVAGLGIPSFDLFETLDAHGHDIDPESIRCADCRQAMASGGFCDGCRMGFVKGKAYLSRLAYHAARGEVRDPSRLDCSTCAANARTHGWCDRCQVGMVGALAVFSRADLEGAREACARLEAALAMLERCETCAIAACTGGRCRACNKSYALEPGR